MLSKETLAFLSDLKENNNRVWFEANKARFTEAQQNAKDFMNELGALLNTQDEIEDFKLFRIYRDVRFSKDKTPYKTGFNGYFRRQGAARRGGYYMSVSPEESVIGGGFYGPNKEDLFRLRKEFEADRSQMDALVNDAGFKQYFGQFLGEQVKTAPKGFQKEHPHIDLIRPKAWYVKRTFTAKEVLDPNFSKEAHDTYSALRPFFDYFSDVLTTDLNGESLL
jgi:uncharacterized protein (TIGR02453 family)